MTRNVKKLRSTSSATAGQPRASSSSYPPSSPAVDTDTTSNAASNHASTSAAKRGRPANTSGSPAAKRKRGRPKKATVTPAHESEIDELASPAPESRFQLNDPASRELSPSFPPPFSPTPIQLIDDPSLRSPSIEVSIEQPVPGAEAAKETVVFLLERTRDMQIRRRVVEENAVQL